MERRSVAILNADIEGFSFHMRDNEEATVKTLIVYREIARLNCERFGGRIVDSPGDNFLAEFPRVFDAVEAAMAIQEEIAVCHTSSSSLLHMRFRIGINFGEVIARGNEIYSEAVIIAARLEGLARGGGICISGSAFDQVNGTLPVSATFIGHQKVKNMEEPVRVYRLDIEFESEEPVETIMSELAEGQRGRILIVENETMWQTSLTSLFTQAGFQVTRAFDCSDVLTQLARPLSLPDLAIVDLDLPNSKTQEGFDGLRVLTELRHQGIYAIVVSGYIHEIIDTISDRPEICDVVDKVRFIDDGFAEYFLAKVDKAFDLSETNQRSEGKLPSQQERLRGLPPMDIAMA